jgi:hypothetical protein
MNHPLNEVRNANPQLVFFKDFITTEATTSIVPKCMKERKLHRPQKSQNNLKKNLNDIDNNRGKSKEQNNDC